MGYLKGKQSLMVTVAAVLLAVIAFVTTGCGNTDVAETSEPSVVPTVEVEITEPDVLDTDVKTVEQLKQLLLNPEELEITVNTELTIGENLEVVGIKKVSGTGLLIAPLGNCDKYSIFDVQEGAELTVTGLTVDGSVTADAITVRKGGKAHLEDVSILWPLQYGVCVYGEAVIKNAVIEHALSAAVVVYGDGNVTLDGAKITNSQAEAMYLDGGSAYITGGTEIVDSGNQGIVNRGSLVIDDASITGCVQYAVVNYGTANISYEGDEENGVIVLSDNLKGAIYNYAGGHVNAKNVKAGNNLKSSIGNYGTMVLSDSEIYSCGSNAIYNAGEMEAFDLNVYSTVSNGVYNVSPGVLNVRSSLFTYIGKRGIHNEGGVVKADGITIDGCGSFGVGNNTDAYGNVGSVELNNVSIGGCKTNVYNQGKGVVTSVSNSVLYKSTEGNVHITNGTLYLNSVRILGTKEEKTYGLYLGKGTKATISGSSEITGCASSGINNRGVLTINYCLIHNNTSHRSGGGIYNEGVVYFAGGEIYNNTATSAGGGVSVSYNADDPDRVGKFYMTGGKIYNNTATTYGGGIVVGAGTSYDGTFIAPYASITGGEIYGNVATTGTGVSTNAAITLGGAVHFVGNTLEVKTGKIVTVTPLTVHSAEDPLVVTAYGKDGAVVMTTDSEEAARNLQQQITSDSPATVFYADGANITIATVTVDINDIDMTNAEEVEVSTFEELKAAVESTASGEKKLVKLTADIAMLDTIKVPADATVQIVDDGSVRTLLRDTSMIKGAFFDVPNGAVFGLKATDTDTLILDGNSGNIQLASSNSSLIITSGETHITGATLKNNHYTGSSGQYGGLVHVLSGAVDIRDAVLTDGYAYNGGAFFVDGGQVTVTDSEISNCKSVKTGGAIYTRGGTFTISGGIATGNVGGSGGGVASISKGATLNVADGTLIDGNQSTNGGAFYVSGSILNGENVVFANNQATTGSGGAIYTASSDGIVVNMNNVTFTQNQAATHGGVINAYPGDITFAGCTFESNTASAKNNDNSIVLSKNAVVNLENCTFYPADADVGEIRLYSGSNELNLSGVNVLGKVVFSDADGRINLSGVLGEGSSMTLVPNEYKVGNVLVVGSVEDIAASVSMMDVESSNGEEWIVDTAGTLAVTGKVASVSGVEYDSIEEALEAAAAGDEVILLRNLNEDITLPAGVTLNCNGYSIMANLNLQGDADLSAVIVSGTVTVPENTQATVGGTFDADTIVLANGATIQIASKLGDDVIISVETDVQDEGTVILTGAEDLVHSEYTKFNVVLTDGSLYLDESGKIAMIPFEAIIGETSYDTLEDAVAAAENGDVIRINNKYTVTAQIEISKQLTITSATSIVCVISRGSANTADAVFNVTADGNLTLANVTIDGGSVSATQALVVNNGTFTLAADASMISAVNSNGPGAVLNASGATAVIGGTISNCTGKEGGAIDNKDGAALTISDGAQLSGNTSSGVGGAIVNRKATLIVGTATFSDNHTESGNSGAIHGATGSTTTITGATFTQNYATGGHGGAVYVTGSTLNISDSIFSGNYLNGTSAKYGGALGVNTKSNVTIVNSTFENNQSNGRGGALYIATDVTAVFTDCSFSGNTAQNEAQTAYIAKGTLTMNSCVITSGGSVEVILTDVASSILNVSGCSQLGIVQKGNSSVISLTGELTEGAGITIRPAAYTEGTVVITEASTGLLANSIQYIHAADAGWGIDIEGKLYQVAE